ncbi:MAG: hypothetical protein IPK87_04055 [Planctomycetes bacterium]|nr:hypothetical protein [Planctomycetota bacterium]
MRAWIYASALLFAAVLLALPLNAGLLDTFAGKSEADIAKDFEAGLPKFLEARLQEQVKPRMYVPDPKRKGEFFFLELVGVEGEKSRWQELAVTGWFPDTVEYAYSPHGNITEYEIAKLPTQQVANWYVPRFRLPPEIIAAAVWAASKQELWVANAKLAELAQTATAQRADIEEYLCGKHGWTRPKDGLMLVETHNLAEKRDSALLLTPEANTERLKVMEKEAADSFKELEALRGDTKGKPGMRKGRPAMRLDILQKYAERFKKAWAGTKFIDNKKNVEKYDRLMETIKEDIDYVTTEKFKAERKGIDGDWKGCADHWRALCDADPHNPDVIRPAAEACSKVAVITDGARKAENPDYAALSAGFYDRLVEIFPTSLSYYNYAGVNWLAAASGSKYADGKKKAKARHEEVQRLVAAKPKEQRTENDLKNLEFAEKQLELIK